MKVLKSKKAFTLVELIVVIAIIGILSAVLIPGLTGYIAKAKESNAIQEAKAIYNIYTTYLTEVESGQAAKDKTFTVYYEQITKEEITDPIWVGYKDSGVSPLVEVAGGYVIDNDDDPQVAATPDYFIYKSGSIYVKVLLNGTASIAITNEYNPDDFS